MHAVTGNLLPVFNCTCDIGSQVALKKRGNHLKSSLLSFSCITPHLSSLLSARRTMVKWRIGERSYRPILNTSHQLQMKIVEFHIMTWLLPTHKHALTCYVCQCHASTFIVDQYVALFNSFTMYCIVHGFMGMWKGMWCGGVSLCTGVLTDFFV